MTLWRSYTARTIVGILAAIVVVNLMMRDRSLYDETLRMLVVGIMAMLAICFTPVAWKCLLTPGWPSRELGAGFTWWALGVCGLISGLTSAFYRMASRPDWVLGLPTSNAWAYGLIAIGLAGMIGPRFFSGNLHPVAKAAIGWAWAVVAVAIVVVWIARPDLTPVAHWIEVNFIRLPSP